MELDSARGLQAELSKELASIGVRAGSGERGSPREAAVQGQGGRVLVAYAATRAEALDPVQRTLALGLTRSGRSDYRIAVRIQRRGLLGSPQVEHIRSRARGEVDVRYVGRLTMRASGWNRARVRPLRIGSSIGHYRITAGTLGAVVRRRDDGGVRLLSNNHVFADQNQARPDDPIIQAGHSDGGTIPADRVGGSAEFVALAKDQVNEIDAALATIDDGVGYDPRTLEGHAQLGGSLLDPSQIEQDAPVEKIGRTTGHTTGRFSAFDINDVVIDYTMLGHLRFNGQIEIHGMDPRGFSDGGDSGSIIYTSGDRLAIGLLFAGGEVGGADHADVTYANPIANVMETFGVDLLI